MISLTTTN